MTDPKWPVDTSLLCVRIGAQGDCLRLENAAGNGRSIIAKAGSGNLHSQDNWNFLVTSVHAPGGAPATLD